MPSDHPRVPSAKLGLLLINLGTPDALDYWSMRRYLGEFLSDKRVVELPQLFWQLILQGPILTFRPKKSAAAYREIWNNELDESPLRTITREQTERLQKRFGDSVRVEFAMRYGNPSIPSLIQTMFDEGCWKIVCMPMYPQYASSTTGSVVDKIGELISPRPKRGLQEEPCGGAALDVVGRHAPCRIVRRGRRHVDTIRVPTDAWQ